VEGPENVVHGVDNEDGRFCHFFFIAVGCPEPSIAT